MKSIFICVAFCLCGLSTIGQKKKERDTSNYIHQLDRIEFDMGYSDDVYHLICGNANGLLVAVETSTTSREGYQWNLHHLDTALNVMWTRILMAPHESVYAGYDFYDGKYYMLFNDSKYQNSDYILYELDTETTEITSYTVHTVFPIVLTEFEVLDKSVLLSGFTNYRPVMLAYDFKENKPKVLPGIYDKKGEILDLIIDDDLKMFTVIVSEKLPSRNYTIVAKTFTSDGDLIQENKVEPGEKKNLVDGVSTNFIGGYQYLAGTYSKKPSTYSRGLYLSRFVNGKQQFVKYHEYANLDNFFGHMGEKREQRVKERIKLKAAKGKSKTFSYRLLVHDIIKRGDEYLMVAEAYYPRYSSYYSGYYYGHYNQVTPGFVGYNFTHAVVVAFDRNGDIKWDNSFSIDNVLSYSLDEFVSVNVYEDKVVLMYLDENHINSKVISGDDIVEGESFSPLKLAYEGDEIKTRDPETEGLKTWYDRTMYAYGEHRIKNAEGAGGKIYRNIFYINKLQYHHQQNAN